VVGIGFLETGWAPGQGGTWAVPIPSRTSPAL
jgi:hypothetical protein